MSQVNKRLLREMKSLVHQQNTRPLLENDFLVTLNEENANLVHAIIKAPADSVYRHTFIRLDLEVPDDYPHSPPKVTFVNHDGVRIHPNMYEDGKVCATILGTWPSDNEKWTSSMGIETVLVALTSFFDNHPYTYEPGGRDDPSYTVYVRYQSFVTCLVRYMERETLASFKDYIFGYFLGNMDAVFEELLALNNQYPANFYHTRCFEIEYFMVNYNAINVRLQNILEEILFNDDPGNDPGDVDDIERLLYAECEVDPDITEDPNETTTDAATTKVSPVDEKDYRCCICFDTEANGPVETLNCQHTFHKRCIQTHIEKNNRVCPLCRQYIVSFSHTRYKQTTTWVINPKTQKRIKVGGKTYNGLVEEGYFLSESN
jgi:ubiquitin-protein ligase